MNDTFSIFLAAYNNAPQNIKDLIDSEEIGLFVDTILTETPPLAPKQKLLVIISNRVLNLTSDSQMISELEKTNLSQPEKIAQIKNFITSKIETTPQNTISPDIPQTESTLKSLSSIRTMAGDNKQVGYGSIAEPTYTSTQSAIINEAK